MEVPLSLHYAFDDAFTGYRQLAVVPDDEWWGLDMALVSNRSGGALTGVLLVVSLGRHDSPPQTIAPATTAAIIWAPASVSDGATDEKVWGSSSAPQRLWLGPGRVLSAAVGTADDVAILLSGVRWTEG